MLDISISSYGNKNNKKPGYSSTATRKRNLLNCNVLFINENWLGYKKKSYGSNIYLSGLFNEGFKVKELLHG